MPYWLKPKTGDGGRVWINEGETCPAAGLGRGKHALRGWMCLLMLAINALLVKGVVGWARGKHPLQG